MTARETILARVREALRAPTPAHGHPSPSGAPTPEELRRLLPAVGSSWEEQRQLFAANADTLKAVFKVVPDAQAAAAEVRRLAEAGRWKRLATHASPLPQSVATACGLDLLPVDGGYKVSDLEACDAGLTGCDALVAQTGSVLVTSRSCGGRALTVLPPHHIVVAGRDQLLPDLPAAFALLRQKYGADYPSMMSFITGPSRTGDIERILVLGAHGPKQLTILLIASQP